MEPYDKINNEPGEYTTRRCTESSLTGNIAAV